MGDDQEVIEVTINAAKKPYTTVGIPARISRSGLRTSRKRRGAYSEAEELHHEALAMRMELFGAENSNVAASLHSLGALHLIQGNLITAPVIQFGCPGTFMVGNLLGTV